jgi:HAE1 family hydrophobic/amphiphilic exporter-1
MDVRVTSDDAVFINSAIREVGRTLAIATLIVVAIIFVFLRSLPVTLIPAVTVPISLAGTLAAMWMFGFSINILTLLALVLATGLVVDDAIVVVENITRQRRLGLGPRAAAVVGTRQVMFAVLATTATLAAVFIPISFFPGRAGSLFVEFGFVLAFAVTVSSFVALTLAPMMASRMMPGNGEQGWLNATVGRFGSVLVNLYGRLLDLCLKAPLIVIVVATGFAAAAVVGYRLLPAELTPLEDRGFIPIFVSAPQASTVGYTDSQIRQLEEAAAPVLESGEATNIFTIAFGSGGGGFMFLTLAPWQERERSQAEITADLNRRIQGIPGVQVFARRPNSLGIRGGGRGLRFAIVGDDYGSLATSAELMIEEMEAHPAFGRIRLSYDTTQPQVSINIDRDRVARIGIPPQSISATIRTLLDGQDLGSFFIADKAIEIRALVPPRMIQDANALDSIQLRTREGQMVPLSSLVTFTEDAVAPSLPRVDQLRAVPVTASLAEGIDLRRAMVIARDMATTLLPAGTDIVFTGEAKELQTASGGTGRIFVFAILVVLLVLAAQFESFVSAFILIATVPFGVAAAIFAILLSGGSLNIYSQIGLVLLVGLMAKNGILIVEFANQLRDAGQTASQAIRNAAMIRLRPVVMTMISTVCGGVPLLLLGGAGSEARQALGWIIVGGLGFATLATLFLTPVVFSLLAPLSRPRIAEQHRLERELAAAGTAGDDVAKNSAGTSAPSHKSVPDQASQVS